MAGTAANAAEAKTAASRALSRKLNHNAAAAYGAILVGIAISFILTHLFRKLRGPGNKSPFLVGIPRKFRSIVLRKRVPTASTGHAIIVFIYLCLNIIFTLTMLSTTTPMLKSLGGRTGWMIMVNLLLVAVMALKNTPFSPLAGWSHERLNIMHRVVGYTTVFESVLHGLIYVCRYASEHNLKRLAVLSEVCGSVATLSFMILGLTGFFLRSRWYELFYYMHVSFWALAIIMTGMHQPETAKKVLWVTSAAASIWLIDRAIRLTRLAYYHVNNTVTLTPLPCGGTRVTLAKPPLGAAPGKHCFLWVPAVRMFETHPFTIAAADPLEFVVAAQDGFTRELHKHAVETPGIPLKASVEGPYGTLPDAAEYDHMILVAGGSGAAFTVGMALNALRAKSEGGAGSIAFVWMVKHRPHVEWFAERLKTLQGDSRFCVNIYVTRDGHDPASHRPIEGIPSVSSPSLLNMSDTEKQAAMPTVTNRALTSHAPDLDKETFVASAEPTSASDTEANSPITPSVEYFSLSSGINVRYGRPDVASLVREAMEGVSQNRRVLVMGCGPKSLIKTLRNSTAELIRPDGPSVDLHCEQFGW